MKAFAGMAAWLRQLSLFDDPQPSLAVGPAPAPTCPSGHPAQAEPAPPAPTDAAAARVDGIPAGFLGLLRGPYARIRVELKPRLRASWRVSWERRGEFLRLEAPAHLADAPPEIRRALLDWSLLVSRRGRRTEAERARRSALENAVRRHLDAPVGSAAAARLAASDARKLSRLAPRGAYHDLQHIFDTVNARYFQGRLEARITWSARFGGLSTHSIARDGEGRPYHLLTISRGYDQPEVTPEILGGVVYHECLHIAIPPRQANGRRIVHGPDFRKREREYDHYEAWRTWHRHELPKALRRMRKRT